MMEYDKSRAISPGVYLAMNCEICGKNKGKFDHKRCSKIKQKRFKAKK